MSRKFTDPMVFSQLYIIFLSLIFWMQNSNDLALGCMVVGIFSTLYHLSSESQFKNVEPILVRALIAYFFVSRILTNVSLFNIGLSLLFGCAYGLTHINARTSIESYEYWHPMSHWVAQLYITLMMESFWCTLLSLIVLAGMYTYSMKIYLVLDE